MDNNNSEILNDLIDLTNEEKEEEEKNEAYNKIELEKSIVLKKECIPENDKMTQDNSQAELELKLKSLEYENKIFLQSNMEMKLKNFKLTKLSEVQQTKITELNEEILRLKESSQNGSASSCTSNEAHFISVIKNVCSELNLNKSKIQDQPIEYLNQIHEKVIQLKQEIEDLNKTRSRDLNNLNSLKKMTESLKEQNAKLYPVNQSVNFEKDTNQVILNLNKIVSSIDSKYEIQPCEYTRIEDVVQYRFDVLDDKIKYFEELYFKSNEKFDEQYRELKERKEHLSTRLNRCEKEKNNQVSKCEHLQQKITNVYERMKQTNKLLEERNIRIENQEDIIRSLKSELRRFDDVYQNQIADIEVIKFENSKLHETNKSYSENEKALKSENSNLKQENEKLLKRLKKLDATVNELSLELKKKNDNFSGNEAQEAELNELKEKIQIILTENDLKQKELNDKLSKNEQDYNDLFESTNKEISVLNDNIEMKSFVIKNLTSKKNELWLAFAKEKEINDALRTKISKFDLIFRQIYDDFKQDK